MKYFKLLVVTLLLCGCAQRGSEELFLGLGWNLGNQMDAHVNGVAMETSWGNRKATQQTFDSLKAVGFTSVRIPVTWLGHIGETPDYTIETAWMDRVAELVDYAENAGLYAIINIHHDGADSRHWLDIKNAAKDEAVNQRVKDQLHAMWTQIANRFKDKGNFLVFAVFDAAEKVKLTLKIASSFDRDGVHDRSVNLKQLAALGSEAIERTGLYKAFHGALIQFAAVHAGAKIK